MKQQPSRDTFHMLAAFALIAFFRVELPNQHKEQT
jgi:hypothetical protein